MLEQILAFKTNFKVRYQNEITDINTFVNFLSDYCNSNERLETTDAYWKLYIHAVFISLFLEIKGYDLKYWNDYVSKNRDIAKILGVSPITKEGIVLEYFVLHSINHVFSLKRSDFGQIIALRANNDRSPNYLTDDSNRSDFLSDSENKRLIDNLKIVMKLRGLPTKEVWGDNDIIVVLRSENKIQQFCIISCKTSLRERVYQSIFWATHSRLEGIGKHVFVTADKGASGRSEIGNREDNNDANKSRDVLESTMDRVYVLRNSEEVNRSQVIKDFQYLKIDLLRWADDHVGK